MSVYALFAESFRYPAPGRLESLQRSLTALPSAASRKAYTAFLEHIASLSLAGWEELYTRTWDLNPVAAPYVGYQVWGENYKRGVFMAQLNRRMRLLGLDGEGELPDHLVPVFRYLERDPQPMSELVENLIPAVRLMHKALARSEPGNPYLLLLEAVVHAGLPSPAATPVQEANLGTLALNSNGGKP